MPLQTLQEQESRIEASVDVCFNIVKVKNLTSNKIGPICFTISEVASSTHNSIPYQCINKQQSTSNPDMKTEDLMRYKHGPFHKNHSTFTQKGEVTLNAYHSPFLCIDAHREHSFQQLVVFKLHVPIALIEDSVKAQSLSYKVSLFSRNEFLYQSLPQKEREFNSDSESIKDSAIYNFLGDQIITVSQILYVDTIVLCIFDRYGINIEGTIKTHLLSFKYKELDRVKRHELYQSIDHLVISYNKIRENLQNFTSNTVSCTTKRTANTASTKDLFHLSQHGHDYVQSKKTAVQIELQNLPKFINMKNQEKFQKIRQFIQNRIFQQQTMKDHRVVLHSFVEQFFPKVTEKLLIIWKIYIQKVVEQSSEIYQERRTKYFERLVLEITNRIQFISKQVPVGLLKTKSMSYSTINSVPETNSHYKNISIEKTKYDSDSYCKAFQIQQPLNRPMEYRKSVSSRFLETVSLQKSPEPISVNKYHQNFDQVNIYQTLKKISILNVQRPYPQLKVKKQEEQSYGRCIPLDSHLDIYHNEPHLFVLVHGLGANNTAFNMFEVYLRHFLNSLRGSTQEGQIFEKYHILNSSSNQYFVNEQIEEMAERLYVEVQQFIQQRCLSGEHSIKLSFIGHSLGGLIIRAALPKLQKYKFHMKTLITLSTPHLGYFFHNSNLNKIGMWTLQKFFENKIMRILLMKDGEDEYNQRSQEFDQYQNFQGWDLYRRTYLYLLSQRKGLSWFEDVVLCGSEDDYFVSPVSALIASNDKIEKQCCSYNTEVMNQTSETNRETTAQNEKKYSKAQIWEEMRSNLLNQKEGSSGDHRVTRLTVKFREDAVSLANTSLKDYILGKKSHVLYLSEAEFIEYLILGNLNWFR